MLRVVLTEEYARYAPEFVILLSGQAILMLGSLFGFVTTHMGRFWVQVQVERRRSGALLLVNLLLASLGATTVLLPGPAFQVPPVPYLIAFFIVSWLLAAAMTSVEFTGIRLLGGRRGYRITARSALTIVSHASYGWIIAGVGMGIAGNVARRFDWLWDGTASTVTGFPDIVVYGLIVAVPVLVGMSVFSGWAGVGAFSMRYANESARPGIGSPRVTSAAEGR